MVAFGFALLIACSLVVAAVGPAILDGGGESAGDDDGAPEADDAFERSLRERIAANPGDAASMVSLANLLATVGELPEAIDWYERALELQPADQAARFNFATSLADAGNQADAELQFRRVLELDPAHVEATFYLAQLYRDWQPARTNEAIALYGRVVELAPDSYLGEQARTELAALGVGAGTPAASGAGTVVAGTKEGRG